MNLYILIFLLIIATIPFFQSKKSKSIIIPVIIFILSVIVGVRYNVGTDYTTYVDIYNSSSPITLSSIETYQKEPLFWLLMAILKTLGSESPVFFFTTISLITSYNIYRTILNFKMELSILSILLYFCLFWLNHQTNTVRHGIMVSYVWLAFSYITVGNRKAFFKYIIIGGLFHSLGFIFLPFIFFLNRTLNKKLLFILLTISIVSVVRPFAIPLLSWLVELFLFPGAGKIIYYVNDYYWEEDVRMALRISSGMLLNLSIAILLYKNRRGLSVKILYFNILFNCLIISSVVAFVFSTVGILVERVSGSLNVCLIFLIPIIIKEYAYNKKIKILYYIVALVYCFLILRANYNKVNRDGIYQFLPYKTVFYK